MLKIEKLTKAQEQHLIEFLQQWLDIGLCCEPANFDKASQKTPYLIFFNIHIDQIAQYGNHMLTLATAIE